MRNLHLFYCVVLSFAGCSFSWLGKVFSLNVGKPHKPSKKMASRAKDKKEIAEEQKRQQDESRRLSRAGQYRFSGFKLEDLHQINEALNGKLKEEMQPPNPPPPTIKVNPRRPFTFAQMATMF